MAIRRSTGFLTIDVNLRKVTNMLKKVELELPVGANLGAKKVAGIYAQQYLDQMSIAGITKWTGRSFNVLQRQIAEPTRIGNGYGVVVPGNLIALDQMPKPHFVKLRGGSSIARWAATKLGRTSGVLSIKRHPWLSQANRSARNRVIGIFPKEVVKHIKSKIGG